MGRAEVVHSFPGMSADRCYTCAGEAFTGLGFDLLKRRPMAWLLQARRETASGSIQASYVGRPGPTASATITLWSDSASDDALAALMQDLLRRIHQAFG